MNRSYRIRFSAVGHSLAIKAMMMICALGFIHSAYQVFAALKSPSAPVTTREKGMLGNTLNPSDRLQRVLEANLFKGNATAAPAGDSLPALHGIFAGADKAASYAIIAEPGQMEKSYRVGDHLASGAEINAISIDEVMIHSGGGNQILRLKKE